MRNSRAGSDGSDSGALRLQEAWVTHNDDGHDNHSNNKHSSPALGDAESPASVWLSLFFLFLLFQDRVSLWSSGCPGTHFVEQPSLEQRSSDLLFVCGIYAHACTVVEARVKTTTVIP